MAATHFDPRSLSCPAVRRHAVHRPRRCSSPRRPSSALLGALDPTGSLHAADGVARAAHHRRRPAISATALDARPLLSRSLLSTDVLTRAAAAAARARRRHPGPRPDARAELAALLGRPPVGADRSRPRAPRATICGSAISPSSKPCWRARWRSAATPSIDADDLLFDGARLRARARRRRGAGDERACALGGRAARPDHQRARPRVQKSARDHQDLRPPPAPRPAERRRRRAGGAADRRGGRADRPDAGEPARVHPPGGAGRRRRVRSSAVLDPVLEECGRALGAARRRASITTPAPAVAGARRSAAARVRARQPRARPRRAISARRAASHIALRRPGDADHRAARRRRPARQPSGHAARSTADATGHPPSRSAWPSPTPCSNATARTSRSPPTTPSTVTRPLHARRGRPEAVRSRTMEQPRVLIVDDEPGVRESLRLILKDRADDHARRFRRGGARRASSSARSTWCCSTS